MWLGACTPIVGDSCVQQADCGTEMFCETSLPGGYCTQMDCEDSKCPDGSVCVRFHQPEWAVSGDGGDPGAAPGSLVSYCMIACETDNECRDEYVCVEDYPPHPFCNDAEGMAPAS